MTLEIKDNLTSYPIELGDLEKKMVWQSLYTLRMSNWGTLSLKILYNLEMTLIADHAAL